MDLDLTDDQELFREATARFIKTACPLTTVRAWADHETGSDYVKQAADLGWFALFVPEELGGGQISGSSVRDAVLVAEERGRLLQPGPFLDDNVVAYAIATLGTEAQRIDVLPALAAGQSFAVWALTDSHGDWKPGAVQAISSGTGFTLSGTARTEGVDCADWILVSARHDGGISQFLVSRDAPGVTIEPLESVDITRRCFEIGFDEVHIPVSSVLGALHHAEAEVVRQLDLATVLLISDTIGATDALFEMTRQYALDRVAFGRPIGSFQAIKHLLADLSLFLEMGKAAATAATRAVADDQGQVSEIVSIAKAFVSERAVEIAQGCFQVHGGIGFTWEHDLHLYLRRIVTNASLYGDGAWHRERVCALHEL
jgi:alkylation response protein AidB-like acyl-CoA dehydrogenase